MSDSRVPRPGAVRAEGTTREALANLELLPRLNLAVTPTPLVRLAALEQALLEELGRPIPAILAKLDAYTGFGLGGNKVRKLEYVLARERLGGVTHLITSGGVQSNHCRVTAAAAARLGLGCVLVVNGEQPAEPRGNAKLHRLFGASVVSVPTREERASAMVKVSEDIANAGGEALTIPLGASTPLGALGYVRAFVEFDEQWRNRGEYSGIALDCTATVFVPSSSAGTLAGLHLGATLSKRTDITLVGVSADTPSAQLRSSTTELAMGAGLRIGWSGDLDRSRLEVADEYVGSGYGVATQASERALELFGRGAGLLLDATYTAKAAAGMIDWIRTGRVDPEDVAVFWHTGGWPSSL